MSTGKVIAFSVAHPVDDHENPGETDSIIEKPAPPMLVQVSMVTTVARPMSSDEFKQAMEWLNKTKDSVKTTFEKGKKFYKDKNIGGAFKALVGVGQIVGGIIKMLPDEEDEMVKNLADLKNEVERLGEKLNQNFSEMKTFITELKFYSNIINPTAVLTKHMQNCLKDPGAEAKANFERAYKKNLPLKLQYDLMSYLKKDTTNPLTINMSKDTVKTKATFEKWEDIFCRVMAQFWFLEAFASGLMASDDSDCERLMDASEEVFENLEKLRNKYMEDQSYWEDLKKYLEPYILKNTGIGNLQKATEIGKILDNYLTHDAFYFCIFNTAKWDENYTYHCANEKDQIVGVWNKGGCNCFVYRSRRGSKASQEAYQNIRRQTIDCGNGKLRWTGTLKNIIRNQLLDQSLLPSNGFIGLIETRLDPQISYFNSLEPDWLNKGPGHLSFALMDLPNDGRREFRFIVSFP